jgi:adenylate cyclase
VNSLHQAIDERLERSLIRHETVGEALADILPMIATELELETLSLVTFGDDMQLALFGSATADDLAAVREASVQRQGERVRVRHPLDVAGEWFGCFQATTKLPADASADPVQQAIAAVSEVLDNHLYGLFAARRKHETMLQVAHALRERVMRDALVAAVGILATSVPFREFALVYASQEQSTDHLQVYVFRGSTLVLEESLGEVDTPLAIAARRCFSGDIQALPTHLGLARAKEEVLINGITRSVVVGRFFVTSEHETFNTYDRDLLTAFAGFIRQRVVDFNKEWRVLAQTFNEATVGRLLAFEDYRTRYLAPREANVAILYADVAGFTALSEQHLRSPSRVAAFVEAWGRVAVDLVWRSSGVFDKMVGDCIIGLFGPPFFEDTPAVTLQAALAAAHSLREATRRFANHPAFPELDGLDVGVTIGVHVAPLFVGVFGPNDNYTGFSSGMNNTARLQSLAKNGEILVMESATKLLPDEAFGPVRESSVKNVQEPLRYRELLRT